MKKYKLLFLLTIFSLLATGCSSALLTSSEETAIQTSTPLIETGVWLPLLKEPIQTSVKELDNPVSSEIAAFYDNSLWLNYDEVLYKYDTQSGSVSPYVMSIENGTGSPSGCFLVSGENTLWALGFSYDELDSAMTTGKDKPYWILRYYDFKSDTFVEVHDVDKILYTKFDYPKRMVEDENGNLWLLLWGGDVNSPTRIIHYDVQQNKASLIDLKSQIGTFPLGAIHDMVFDHQGMLWLSLQAEFLPDDPNPNYHQAYYWKIFRYNPKSQIIKSFSRPAGAISGTPDLFVDRNDRLWTNSIAWIDLLQSNNPQWSPAVQPFQLFTDSFGWSPPWPIYETSDGALWLRGDFGLKVYYPPTNQWYNPSFVLDEEHYFGSMVVEDDRHQVWAFADGQIYKLTHQ